MMTQRLVTINGETRCLKTWARIYGIAYGTVICRIRDLHWSEVRAITTPVRRK